MNPVTCARATSIALEQSFDALIDRARVLRYRDPRGAVTHATRALAAADTAGDRGGCVRALRMRGDCLARLADLEHARADIARAELLLADLPDDRERGWVLMARACLLDGHGAHADAMVVARQALDLHRLNNDRVGEGEALNVAGGVADRLGDHARALELFQECRRAFEETNDNEGLYSALSNIATIHARLGDHERAIEQLEQVLSLSVGSGSRWHEALALLNIGAAQLALGNTEQALARTHHALDLARALGERRMEAQALTNLGEIRVQQGEALIACDHLVQAVALCVSAGLRPIEVEARTLLGAANTMLGEYVTAEGHLRSALELAEQIGSPFLHDVHLALSNLHSKRGDHARALLHHRLFHEAKESAWGARLQQRVRATLLDVELESATRVERDLRERNNGLHAANEEKSQLLTTLAERTAALERLSFEDGLTGLHNRRYLDAQLALEWDRCKQYGHALSVAVLDVDHFKSVNDTYGHAAGDAVLGQLASHLRSHTRRVDIVSRYGGEEFALVFVETPLEIAAAICEQLRLTVAMMNCTSIAVGLRITVSIGLAAMDGATSPTDLLAVADERLYGAKRAGRNTVVAR